jgi:hypothetical protein
MVITQRTEQITWHYIQIIGIYQRFEMKNIYREKMPGPPEIRAYTCKYSQQILSLYQKQELKTGGCLLGL